MQFRIFYDKGKIRENNEDNYLIKEKPYPLLVVADGMGGHQAGEVASKIAIDEINKFSLNFEEDIFMQIEKAIRKANKNIFERANNNSSYRGMGTTLSMGIIINNYLYIGHIGDSRIYLFRENNLSLETKDHTLVQKYVDDKKIKQEEAFYHPQKHILTQALGVESNLNIQIKKILLQENDILIFCTDGLSDMLKKEDIKKILLNNNLNIDDISNVLGKEALNKGGIDNITFIAALIN